MANYTQKKWLDHILDQNNNIVQQGTPVSAGNLNNLEIGVKNANTDVDNASNMIRDSIPSGCIKLSDLDYVTMMYTPNTIKLVSESIFYVNGYKITIPAGTTITLNAPPTTGTREDLVFLEVYFTADTNGANVLNYRIRVVDNVDFNTYPEGFPVTHTQGYQNKNTGGFAFVQGGNATPFTKDNTSYNQQFFALSNATSRMAYTGAPQNDTGLYVAGDGTSTYKTSFATTDGYVYAIPLFRVKRRNSGGYSVSNANGSSNFFTISYTRPSIGVGQTAQITNVTNYNLINVGDVLVNSTNVIVFSVISKDGTNTLTVKNIGSSDLTANSVTDYRVRNRYDNLFADIIVERDIIDLRHLVSLTGFNYETLQAEAFGQLLRNELQTKAKKAMIKTYHGIPKTPIDANTVFYASLDGTIIPELGGSTLVGSLTNNFEPFPTGLGLSKNISRTNWGIPQSSILTLDTFVHNSFWSVGSYIGFVISNPSDSNSEYNSLIGIRNDRNLFYGQNNSSAVSFTFNPNGAFTHVRITIDATGLIKLYLNGKLITSRQIDVSKTVNMYNAISFSGFNRISDVSISNIDRGSTFATLPQDFIDGYARISTAFNGQRKVFSDALVSEYVQGIVKATDVSRPKQQTVTQATAGQWASGDTIKIKGIGGELVSGVIDSDTALAKVTTQSTINTTGTLNVDDVSKISVGDTLKLVQADGVINRDITITAIDTTNKVVTYTSATGLGTAYIDWLLIETTATTSVPTVKANLTGTGTAGASASITLPGTFSATDDAYNNLDIVIVAGTGAGQRRTITDYVGSTKAAIIGISWTTNPDTTSQFIIYNAPVTGTWSNLGTNEATFTLGTNSLLTNQDIQIEYSLIESKGQGATGELYIGLLGGEANGNKLVVGANPKIIDDFKDKVSGDTVANPHKFKYQYGTSLLSPTASFNESSPSAITSLDSSTYLTTTATNTYISQQLFSFNLIEIVERKLGKKIPSNDKVKWLRDNIKSITANWYGYGTCPSGNKANIARWSTGNSNWSTYSIPNNTNNTPTLITVLTNSSLNDIIDPKGFVHYLAYTDATDGVTASAINTDYINIEVLLNTPTGFEALTWENPRAREASGNALFVRRETKEVQGLFSGLNTDGVITYGDYIPKQSRLISEVSLAGGYLLTELKGYFTTLTTKGITIGNNKATKYDLLDEFSIIDTQVNSSLVDGSQLGTSVNNIQALIQTINFVGSHSAYGRTGVGKITSVANASLGIYNSLGSIINYYDISKYQNKNIGCVLIITLAKNINGNLVLLIGAKQDMTTGGINLDGTTGRIIAYELPNRPLLKV